MISKPFFAPEAQSSQSPSLVVRTPAVLTTDFTDFRVRKPNQSTRLGLCELCASVAKHPIIAAGRFDTLNAPSLSRESSTQPYLDPGGERSRRPTAWGHAPLPLISAVSGVTALPLVPRGERGGGAADVFAELLGGNRVGGGPPAEDPMLDLGQGPEAEPELQFAAG